MADATEGGEREAPARLLARVHRLAARAPRHVLGIAAAAVRRALPGARVDILLKRPGRRWAPLLTRPPGEPSLPPPEVSGHRAAGGGVGPPLLADMRAAPEIAGSRELLERGYTHRVVLPIRAGHARGLLSVAVRGRAFRPGELRLLGEIGAILAPALAEEVRRARAERALERARFVQRLTVSVNRSLTVEGILRHAVARIAPVLRPDRVELLLRPATSGDWTVSRLDATDAFHAVETEVAPDPGAADGNVPRIAEPVVVTELLPDDADPCLRRLAEGGFRWRLSLRLVARRRVVGTFHVLLRRGRAPSVDALALLRHVARPLAMALENARQHREASRRSRQMTALYHVGQALSSAADVGDVTERVLWALHDSFDFNHSAVLTLETDGAGKRWLVMRASRGYSGKSAGDFRVRVGDRSVTSRAVVEGRLVHVPDVRLDPDYVPGVEQGRSEVAVPIEVSGRIVGVLDVESTEVAAFDAEDLETLKLFSTQVGLALERARIFEEVRRQATTDSVSGLLNQRSFEAKVERELDRSGRTGRPFVLALMDIDDFKRVNDAHGHVAGNAAIARLGAALRARVRPIDAAARFGGDEFALVLSEMDEGAALEVMSAVHADLRSPAPAASCPAFTVSAGVAGWRPELRTVRDLVAAADRELYRAKGLGKDRTCATSGAVVSGAPSATAPGP